MTNENQKIVVQLGYLTDKHVGVFVAEEFMKTGVVTEADVATLASSREHPNETKKTMKNAIVITHSHGLSVVDSSTGLKKLIIVGGPEPQNTLSLLSNATAGALRSVWNQVTSKGDYRIFFMSSMKTALLHPVQTIKGGLEVTDFSTIDKLKTLVKSLDASRMVVVVMKGDKLFPVEPGYRQQVEDLGVRFIEIDGAHNDLYEKSEMTVGAICRELFPELVEDSV